VLGRLDLRQLPTKKKLTATQQVDLAPPLMNFKTLIELARSLTVKAQPSAVGGPATPHVLGHLSTRQSAVRVELIVVMKPIAKRLASKRGVNFR